MNRAASKGEFKRLGWDEKERPRRRKGDPQKVKLGWAAAPGNHPELEMDHAAVADGQLDLPL